MYEKLEKNKASILADAKKAADEIGIPQNLRGKLGLTGAVSGCPAQLWRDVTKAMEEAYRAIIPNRIYANEIRDIVKDVYGDDYDAASVNTCEAALWVSISVMISPPMTGRGESYRARYIAPLERHMHHQGGYGRPFPSKYKGLVSDRGVTAGELGMEGKRQWNTDVIIVPQVGATYQAHGIKYANIPFLNHVEPEKTAEKMGKIAALNAETLCGFASLAYDTSGYGYGKKDTTGTPLTQKLMGQLAKEWNVPYIQDNAWGIPFIGTDLSKTQADLMVYSMDKAALAPTSGLIIGKEDAMISIRKALGMHGERWGTTSAYGKAQLVTADAGKEGLVGQIAALKILRDEPKRVTKSIDETFEIVREEFEAINLSDRLKKGFVISKSYNCGAVEVNTTETWKEEGEFGVPIFGIEDMYSGAELYMHGVMQMGLLPTISYDGNLLLSPGLGTLDKNGELLEDNMRYAVKGSAKMIEIVCKHAGIE